MARKIYDDSINIDKKLWLEILNDREITKQNTMDVLRVLFESQDHEERSGIIAKTLGYSCCGTCNSIIKSYGNRIVNTYSKIKCPKYENGKNAPFHVSLLGEYKNGFFYWKLRPELAEALKVYKPE